MTRHIDVFLGHAQQPIGVLRYESDRGRQSASFEYRSDWITAAHGFPIQPGLPLVAGPQFHRAGRRDSSPFHGAISDTEPDGWGRRVIMRDHAKQRQRRRQAGKALEREVLNDLDYLLAVDDQNRVGALRMRDEHCVFQRTPEAGRRTPPLIELGALLSASRAVELNEETAQDLAYLRGRGTSLGGLRPKCSVIDDDGALSIGKFPSVDDDRAVAKGEVLALLLARAAGIDAAHARLIETDGLPVALIRRFDRGEDGTRLMYVSAATMIGADAGGAEEHSYTDLADALRQHGANPRADIEELWRRIVFSVLITNVDDHLHNHGFLHQQEGRWRLAPAFDVNPFPERARVLKTWISEAAGPEASIEAAIEAAPYFQVDRKRVREILRQVLGATARWRKTGASIGMSRAELDAFANAFEHAERDKAVRLLR